MRKINYFLLFLVAFYIGNKIIIYFEYPQLHIQQSGKRVTQRKAIVVGASSGMGRAVAKLLAFDGYEVGLVARRTELLYSLQKEIPTKTYVKQIDVSLADTAKQKLESLIEAMGGLDLMLISVSALGGVDSSKSFLQLSFDEAKKFIEIDVLGFWVAVRVAIKQFEKQGYGHLVGMSSIDAIRGSPIGPEYSGAKSFALKYLEGIRNRMIIDKKPIFVTTIMPGWVDVERETYSAMPGTFWVASTQEAARQIFDAIKKKKERVYITKRWRLIAWLFSIIPDWLYRKIDG